MNQGIIFATIAAVVFGLWSVFHQLASKKIDGLLGAIIISLVAVILGIIILVFRAKNHTFIFDYKTIIFVVLAGVCALAIDFFALKAYSSGLEISVVAPVIIGGSIAVASFIGFFLGEVITLYKIVGILFILIGSIILSIFSS